MFAAGSLDATETFDGCPVVHLSDHWEDLRGFLQYLIPCLPLALWSNGIPLVGFPTLRATIHLAHKYQCPDVEAHALFVLKKYYTSNFAEHNAYSVSATTLAVPLRSSAIAAINIARLTETPSMLPFALYLACSLSDRVMDGYKRRDGSDLAPVIDAVFAPAPSVRGRDSRGVRVGAWNTSVSFDEISAVIRLAHQDHIPSIQEQALSALQVYHFTSDFDAYFDPPKTHISLDNIQSIGAVNLARLTDTPLMLPSALYTCCYIGGRFLDGWTPEDGTVEHLSTDDIRRCFDARVLLAREEALLPSCLVAHAPLDRCVERGRCQPHVTALGASPMLVGTVMKEDVLTDRSLFIKNYDMGSGICDGCVQVLLERERLHRKRIWDGLPLILGIVVEGWGKADQ